MVDALLFTCRAHDQVRQENIFNIWEWILRIRQQLYKRSVLTSGTYAIHGWLATLLSSLTISQWSEEENALWNTNFRKLFCSSLSIILIKPPSRTQNNMFNPSQPLYSQGPIAFYAVHILYSVADLRNHVAVWFGPLTVELVTPF
jgi:hypothetical protein